MGGWVACVVALLSTTACIQAELVPCGDRLCPTGTQCVGGMVCATTEQIDACAALLEGDPCDLAAGTGTCVGGVCTISGCGNGVLEADEACDDGNAAGGDGCSADCAKIEVCGDGFLDELEICDDGNTNAIDGCDACRHRGWSASAVVGGNTLAVKISLDLPYDVAVDRFGNYFIADSGSERVFRVDRATNTVTVVAGGGTGGDGGQATDANIGNPTGVAVDDLGNLYIAAPNSARVRRVAPNGVITTIAGTGVYGYSGDNGPATAAQLYAP